MKTKTVISNYWSVPGLALALITSLAPISVLASPPEQYDVSAQFEAGNSSYEGFVGDYLEHHPEARPVLYKIQNSVNAWVNQVGDFQRLLTEEQACQKNNPLDLRFSVTGMAEALQLPNNLLSSPLSQEVMQYGDVFYIVRVWFGADALDVQTGNKLIKENGLESEINRLRVELEDKIIAEGRSLTADCPQ